MAKTPPPEFPPKDAQMLIQAAEAAPLQNLAQAQQLSSVLVRFQAWYNHIMVPVAEAPAKPARKNRTTVNTAPDPLA